MKVNEADGDVSSNRVREQISRNKNYQAGDLVRMAVLVEVKISLSVEQEAEVMNVDVRGL